MSSFRQYSVPGELASGWVTLLRERGFEVDTNAEWVRRQKDHPDSLACGDIIKGKMRVGCSCSRRNGVTHLGEPVSWYELGLGYRAKHESLVEEVETVLLEHHARRTL